MLSRLMRAEDGQDMIEYALLVSSIAITAVVAVQTVGPLFEAFYRDFVVDAFRNAVCY